jgi:hypothetical protein
MFTSRRLAVIGLRLLATAGDMLLLLKSGDAQLPTTSLLSAAPHHRLEKHCSWFVDLAHLIFCFPVFISCKIRPNFARKQSTSVLA